MRRIKENIVKIKNQKICLQLIAWGVIGATSVFAALNTYEVSIALLTKKGSE